MINEENSSNLNTSDLPSMPALLAFERAAARSSFVGAARDLGRTPSAISHAVKDLEDRLGISLFERVGRSVKLTKAGAIYLDAVQTSLSELQAATRRLVRSQEAQVIRVSALPFFTSAILLPNLGRFEADYPQYDLRLETSNGYADILNGEADIALRFGEEHSEDLVCKPLIAVGGQPIASPSYLKNSLPVRQLQDFNRHTLIHVRPNEKAWQNWFTAHGGDELNSKHNLIFDSILGALDAVKNGLGIALGMYPLISAYRGYGVDFVPVSKPAAGFTMNYNFICQKTAFRDRKIQHTLKWLECSLSQITNENR